MTVGAVPVVTFLDFPELNEYPIDDEEE